MTQRGRASGGQRRSSTAAAQRPARTEQPDVPLLDPSGLHGIPAAQQRRLAQSVREASDDFLGERFGKAAAALRPLASRYAAVAEVQELYGLTLYRLGRWEDAVARLTAFEEMTGDLAHLPVIADCHRALGRPELVRGVWDRLRRGDVPADVLTEGRIVAAGALADQERLLDAIRLLEAGPLRPKRPRSHHLRLWYALADLYDRAGELQRARHGFERLAAAEPGYYDVRERLSALGARTGTPPR